MADTDTRKRSYRDDASQQGIDVPQPQAKRKALGPWEVVVFRIVVHPNEIGKVIGKQGQRIRKIREDTGATIKIVDTVVKAEDRVIVITSQVDDTGGVCKAETALHCIASLLLTESENGAGALKIDAGVARGMLQLLISGCQTGSVLGVYGQFIEEIKSSSRAMITILDPRHVTCLCTQESDRIVQISGEVPQVFDALEKISSKLRENPPQKTVITSPSYGYLPSYCNPYSSYHSTVNTPFRSVVPAGLQAERVTYEMLVMENFVGGLIGINGSNISNMRYESGATIKIAGIKGENMQRLVTFEGSAQQVAIARMLVDNYIFSQLMRQTRH